MGGFLFYKYQLGDFMPAPNVQNLVNLARRYSTPLQRINAVTAQNSLNAAKMRASYRSAISAKPDVATTDANVAQYRQSLLKTPEERKLERMPPEFRKAREQERFIPVTQGNSGEVKIQDLQAEPGRELMTGQDVSRESSAIGAQTQRAIQAMQSFKERQKSEQEKSFVSRYGQEALQKAQQTGSEFARQEAQKASAARLRATHGGANLSPEAREVEATKQRDFERWNRGEIGDVKRQGEEGAEDKFANVPIRSRTQSVLDQSERAGRMMQAQREKNRQLFRTESYRETLKEGILSDLAAAGWKWATSPRRTLAKITDPIVGRIGKALGFAPRTTVKAMKGARAAANVGTIAGVGGLGYGMYSTSNLGQGGRQEVDVGDGQPSGRLTQTIGTATTTDAKHREHQKFMGKVAAAKSARDEREALIKTQMAQTGSDRKSAVGELEKDLQFNKLTTAAKRFETGSSAYQLGTNKEQRKAAADAAAKYRKDYLEASPEERKYGGKEAYATKLRKMMEPQQP